MIEKYSADVLIIGGGTAGLFAAIRLSEFNPVTKIIERLGLTIEKDNQGNYVERGWRNVIINGENIKLILADTVKRFPNVKIFNHVNATNFLLADYKVIGAYGFNICEKIFYNFTAKVMLIATGGASGIYLPNHAGDSRHQMWYSPFNTGAGYAMGIRSGAEMTTFEMRFIALRYKDTIAPTGTLAQGVGAAQINSHGELYQKNYGNTTGERVLAVTSEKIFGHAPCYLKTVGISAEQEKFLLKAYLNMSPAQTLRWIETNQPPSKFNVEICGTEPYIIGGHTAAGYWVDKNRQTTLKNLYAARDVAGGCPQKYVTGAFA